jgi:hypothetical protein
LKVFEWPENLRIIFQDAFKSCRNLTSTDLPDNLYAIYASAFQWGFGPDGSAIKLYLPGSIRLIQALTFQGYSNDAGGLKKIRVLQFGDEEHPVGEFNESVSVTSTAFVNTTIDYVIIYCDTTHHSSWTSESALKCFPALTNVNNIKFPNSGDDISQIS